MKSYSFRWKCRCHCCGETFVSKRRDAIYDTDVCRKRAERRRKNPNYRDDGTEFLPWFCVPPTRFKLFTIAAKTNRPNKRRPRAKVS